MNRFKVLIVGCGELGSRHLQAVATLKNVGTVAVVDMNAAALATGKTRLNEIADCNPQIQFNYSTRIEDAPSGGDLCIVATQSKGRCAFIENIVTQLSYKKFLVEKVVAQSVEEYRDLLAFANEQKLSVWVNCKMRAYGVHQYIKSQLKGDEPFIFTRVGGNHGLGCNGIHAADLFTYYSQTAKIRVVATRIDDVLHSSKRGRDIFDLSGALYGVSDKGDDFAMTFSANHQSPDYISVVSAQSRFIIDHLKKFGYESHAANDWEWEKIDLSEEWRVSHMSKKFIDEILVHNTCALPTLIDCFPAHEFILETLQPHFNRLLKNTANFCPIT